MMRSIHISEYKSPLGNMLLGELDGDLCLCDWKYRKLRTAIDHRIQKHLNAAYREKCTALHIEATHQLDAYFRGERIEFSIPFLMVGSDFQKQVWEALVKIPYGTTTSYSTLSAIIQYPEAIRAVAGANGANALAIIVPCHRVIGSNGTLTGYAGGLSAKKKLLAIESKSIQLGLPW